MMLGRGVNRSIQPGTIIVLGMTLSHNLYDIPERYAAHRDLRDAAVNCMTCAIVNGTYAQANNLIWSDAVTQPCDMSKHLVIVLIQDFFPQAHT